MRSNIINEKVQVNDINLKTQET